tara:strand:+ start:307 stop:1431 length:1125 start_codon:yes stop_codon:yes gene_type:complete
MLQNKIYLNYLIQIFKTFIIILFGLSVIALTVRAVNFLDLIVDSGYDVTTYFKYSILNLFGIAPKFIPLSFLLALFIFILKHKQNSEFIILWTSGVKKVYLVHLFFIASTIILIIYLFFTTFITPLALNKSRLLLSNENFGSFVPTVRSQQFSDSFEGFTFIVEKKINNELKNIFLHDKGNNLKNLSSNTSKISSTTILAESGIANDKMLVMFNGQIISTKENFENEIIKFEQLNIDLRSLRNTTIKKPKIQETGTISLAKCLFDESSIQTALCNDDFKKEILSTLNRRIVIPFYIPVLSLICSLLLIKSKKNFFQNLSIFSCSFFVLLFTELAVRYTGLNSTILYIFITMPFSLLFLLYAFLIYKFSNETMKI